MKRKPSRPLSERFWERVQRTDGCWLWTGNTSGRGYGVLRAGEPRAHPRSAHRLSWELHYGPIPEGLFVCHHCDNPPCVRPDHLFLGSQLENIADMMSKGRHAPAESTRHPGSENGRAKITEEEARAICVAYAAIPRKQRARRGDLSSLARRYGLTTTMVLNIVRGSNWGHVLYGIEIQEVEA
jgi:hypothetical protein